MRYPLTLLVVSLSALGLSGCQEREFNRLAPIVETTLSQAGYGQIAQVSRQARSFYQQVKAFEKAVKLVWGDQQYKQPTNDHFVRYTEGYRSRAEVDFSGGVMTVSTVDTKDHLKKAIVQTLLTPEDPKGIDLYSDKPIPYSSKPFLYGQILDTDRKPVYTQWRAERFADYLIAKKAKYTNRGGKARWVVTVPMEKTHTQTRANKYIPIARKYAQQYQMSLPLVMAIMQTESSFNPYAVSSSPAFGLMQIVPKTAGRDAYQLIHKRSGQPTQNYLFDPNKNIRMGTAYLHILDRRYLKGVKHPQSREYAVISGYNGGAGNVLKLFGKDRQYALNRINQLTPAQLYSKLNTQHPWAETRRYIEKVTQAKKNYMSL